MPNKKKRVLIAAGGTGGHLFPAQALAKDLMQEDCEVLFAANGLSSNRNFQKEMFPHREVQASSPYFRKGKSLLSTLVKIQKGIFGSLALLKEFKPDLVIGFGSFYSFPVLIAAIMKRIPIVLFESNSIPGKVNRLFARWAKLTAIQFSETAKHLSGKSVEVKMPIWELEKVDISQEEARRYFSLDPNRETFLAFGGSQGASSINEAFLNTALLMKAQDKDFQVIHFTGDEISALKMKKAYALAGIDSCVKAFETKMPLAWKAASIAVCRAGAATLSELIAFVVPSILIPFPNAADDHQRKNAEVFEKEIGCALHIADADLNENVLSSAIEEVVKTSDAKREKIRSFKLKENSISLSDLVQDILR